MRWSWDLRPVTGAGGRLVAAGESAVLRPGLARAKRLQLERFAALRRSFGARYEAARRWDAPSFVRRDWAGRNRSLERHLLPSPPLRFLRHPHIRFQMFVPRRFLDAELPFLERRVSPGALRRLLEEDPIGGPVLTRGPGGTVTSANTVHHLHHLVRFQAGTGVDVSTVRTVVEWGGGYGNLSKLFRRLHGGSPTYVLIDTPLFACLQWLYLSSIVGPEAVRLLTAPDHPVEEGLFNVVPVGLVPHLPLRADVFVSTWALNESSVEAQEHVTGRRWFDAPRFLLGMHRGDPLEDRAIRDGAAPEEIGRWLSGQRYLFR